MLKQKISEEMHKEDIHYCKLTNHFSYNKSINFGIICDMKEITLNVRSGIHNNIASGKECIIFIEKGSLIYNDNKGNIEVLHKNDLLYLNGGEDLTFYITNMDDDKLEFLQLSMIGNNKLFTEHIKIYSPPNTNQTCTYIVSNNNGLAPIKCSNDINLYKISLDINENYNFHIRKNRQGYLFLCHGKIQINTMDNREINMNPKDGIEIYEEEIFIKALDKCNLLLMEMEGF